MIKKKAVAKKPVKKKQSKLSTKVHKKHRKPRITQTSSEVTVEKILIQNFVSLQKVMTNLSMKFDHLTNQISKLLELFEISAKSLAEKEFNLEKFDRDDKKVVEKIDSLLEQNKTIARGLSLIHEKAPEQDFNYPSPQKPLQIQKPISSMPPAKQSMDNVNREEYQKSISPREPAESMVEPSEPTTPKFKPLPKNQDAQSKISRI